MARTKNTTEIFRDVPPIPKSIPTAINKRNTGVAIDTPATISALSVCPIKTVSAKLKMAKRAFRLRIFQSSLIYWAYQSRIF